MSTAPLFVWEVPEARSFHSRAHDTPHQIAHGDRKAHEQEAAVLAWFRDFPGRYSPSQVWRQVFGERVPITSVRRCLTNLSDRDRYPNSLWPPLTMTAERVMGPWGRMEHLWEMSGRRTA